MIDGLASMQAIRKKIAMEEQFAKDAFGNSWAGEDSPWAELTGMLTWAEAVARENPGKEVLKSLPTATLRAGRVWQRKWRLRLMGSVVSLRVSRLW